MKVFLIDKNLVDPVNRSKWMRFAQLPGVNLMAVTPSLWMENYRDVRFQPSPQDTFPITPLPVVWPGFENRGFYRGGIGRKMKSFAPDVVIAFEEPFSLFGLQSVAAARRYAPEAKIALFTWDNISGGKSYPYRPRRLYQCIERWTMQRASLLLAANQEAADRFAPMYNVPVRKLYFGIDLERFTARGDVAASKHSESSRFALGYLGRLIRMKGLDDMLVAMALLPPSVHLSIVGDGPDRTWLGQQIKIRGLENRVAVLPGVKSSDVPDVLAGLDALILPSRTTPRWKEQYGRVLIEAMSCGTPVIGSSSGAIPEVIGSAGLIFPEGDPTALAECVGALVRDVSTRDRLTAAGKARAKEFSAESFATHLHQVLEDLFFVGRNI